MYDNKLALTSDYEWQRVCGDKCYNFCYQTASSAIFQNCHFNQQVLSSLCIFLQHNAFFSTLFLNVSVNYNCNFNDFSDPFGSCGYTSSGWSRQLATGVPNSPASAQGKYLVPSATDWVIQSF